ncbi:hypothetical protein ACH5RR_025616 [Cinchona calisaya]|uniref:Vomeronasal type-1 receptor n=1 Tax=Cinchona calisaya TaxID=153742 RepID=A0ABD2Z197_9GENT
MPGPEHHIAYSFGSGLALMKLSNGRFSTHHCLTYAVNAFFFGLPEMGSFLNWLTSTLVPGRIMTRNPFCYVIVLGLPLSLFYSCASRVLIHIRLLDSIHGMPLTKRQCFYLVSAASLSHFFLDHLFEENGQSSMYNMILRLGWSKSWTPINLESLIVSSFLCCCLLGGFVYINRVKSPNPKSLRDRSHQSSKLILIVASLYSLWCASQIHLAGPPRSALGEEAADLRVILFLSTYFFLPHWFCIMSMNSKKFLESS